METLTSNRGWTQMLHVYVYDEGNRQVKVKQALLLGIYMYDGQNRQVFLKQARLLIPINAKQA